MCADTARAASRSTRRALTPSRGAPARSSPGSPAATPVSWASRSPRRSSSCRSSMSRSIKSRSMAVTEEILVNVTPQETRVAVIEQGVTQEVHVERASSRGLVGNIVMGRVVRVLPGMQSAFIDIGGERAAFLHVADMRAHRHNGEQPTPIERLLGEGQQRRVQVVKGPIGTKGARLSTQISIAGRFLVYLPQESHIGISQRIEDEEERAHLREKLQQLLPPEEKGGFIIRTVAETASERELKSDVDYLRRLWGGIQDKAASAAALTLLYRSEERRVGQEWYVWEGSV